MTEDEFRTGIMNTTVDEKIATEAKHPKSDAGAGVVAIKTSTEAPVDAKDVTGSASGLINPIYAKLVSA